MACHGVLEAGLSNCFSVAQTCPQVAYLLLRLSWAILLLELLALEA